MIVHLARPGCQFMFQIVYGSNIMKHETYNMKHKKNEKHKSCSMFHVPCSMKQKGSIILEAFIAIMVISVAFATLLDIGTLSVQTSTSITKSSQANFLAKEAIEATRSFRDGTTWATDGLGVVSTGEPAYYYVVLDTGVTPNKWALTSGTETVGIFTRKIIFDQVSRDPSTQNIENPYNASHDDPNTRKATASVSWESRTLNLTTYLTNWK